jgi:hypothetical protein
MVILLAVLLALATYLFCSSSGASLTKREAVWLYLGMALLTCAFQLQVRLPGCEGFKSCGSSVSRAIVWSVVWPVSWIAFLGLS